MPTKSWRRSRQIRSIGYRAVELSSVGPLPPRELARVLDGEGLTCCSTHEDVEELLTDPEGVIERLEVLGCKATVYPVAEGPGLLLGRRRETTRARR